MSETRALSVSEATELIKRQLEDNLPPMIVEGEISNWRPASSGHCYFSLKDGGAILQAVMFKGRAQALAFRPVDGMTVKARGSVSVYAARGVYQIVCESMEKAGIGDILARLEALKKKLAGEGLFDEERKRPLPRFPGRVAIVTSPTGAAIRDVLNVLGRRAASLDILILPAAVQGQEAPSQIVEQIERANALSLAEVLVVCRGGGSLEDLLAFSDESVVRAIAASAIPVISAVGHETDWSLSDFAADLRAPTPSAAAEIVSAGYERALAEIGFHRESMTTSIRSRLDRVRLLLKSFNMYDLETRFHRILQPRLMRFDDAKEALLNGAKSLFSDRRRRLELALKGLESSDPSSILARGYAIVRKLDSHEAIRDAGALEAGDRISLQFARGASRALVEGNDG